MGHIYSTFCMMSQHIPSSIVLLVIFKGLNFHGFFKIYICIYEHKTNIKFLPVIATKFTSPFNYYIPSSHRPNTTGMVGSGYSSKIVAWLRVIIGRVAW